MPKGREKTSCTVIVGVSASIAAYRSCDLILEMRKRSWRVVPVLSRDAHHFITPLTLQALAGSEVYQNFFEPEGRGKPVHIDLVNAANAMVLAPASADLIARVSLGLADDLLSCMVLAAGCPVVVAPAMNERMYANPVTREHIARLKARGFTIVEPVEGRLVCGEFAKGHIAPNEEIMKAVSKILGKSSS